MCSALVILVHAQNIPETFMRDILWRKILSVLIETGLLLRAPMVDIPVLSHQPDCLKGCHYLQEEL